MTTATTITERLHFPGAHGDRLAARLELPSVPSGSERPEPTVYALFAHCFTCSKDYKALRRISRSLAERGIGVLRFDFTGLGESEGEFADTNFSSNLEDLLAAAAFLREHYRAPALLVGHSLGGAAMLAVAERIPEVQAVATIAAPGDTRFLRETLTGGERAPGGGSDADTDLSASIGGQRFRIRRQLLDDLSAHSVSDAARALGRPLIVLHSPDDETVGIAHAERIFAAARQPKSFVALPGADHLLVRDPGDAPFVGAILAAFAERYLRA